uniref:hypothetical protein n=1 Tax=Methylobacterium nigriterrae TaxID=3127512 RepID=UPI003013E6D5
MASASIPALGVRVFEFDLLAVPEPFVAVCKNPTTELALEGWCLRVLSEEPDGPRTIHLEGVGPGDWREIDALKGVSGIGRYTARVVLQDERLADRPAVIDLGRL